MINKFKDKTADEVLKENPAFCAAPWLHTHIWPDSTVHPCCLSESQKPLTRLNYENSFEEIWNGKEYKKLRQDLLNGKQRPDICHRCYTQEKHFPRSLRNELTNRYWKELQPLLDQTTEDFNAPMHFVYWDYRFNNICNLTCRTCGPDLSSSWYEDQIKRFGNPRVASKFLKSNINENIYRDLVVDQIENVREIYFAGGEPLLMPEHLDIIQRLLEANKTDLYLRYSTNLTSLSFKDFDFTTIWPKFDRVELYISLDEINDRAEYWRSGTNWKRLESNLMKVRDLSKQNKNFRVGFAPTISIFNIHRLDVYADYILDNDLLDDNLMVNFNILQGPRDLNINVAPPPLKEMAFESLDKLFKKSKLICHKMAEVKKGFETWLSESPVDAEEQYFKAAERFATIDKVKNVKLVDVAPELYQIYKKYDYDSYYKNFTPYTLKK